MTITGQKAAELLPVFNINGDLKEIFPITNGNINQTYDISVDINGKEKHFVLQDINVFVFKNPRQIMKNIELITTHIASKLEKNGDDRNKVMHFLYTGEGKNYFEDGEGFFRISEFVPESVTYNSCDDLNILRSAGKAFGNFQVMLSDFDASKLFETIPDFHNTRKRFDTFFAHVKEDCCGRVLSVAEEISQIENLYSPAVLLNRLLDEKKLPLRVTHNDTKINNIIFDKNTNEAKTVIDLDTVMPGLVAHDFGDAIRFAANKVAEDSSDFSDVSLDMDRFEAFAQGFVGELKDSLNRTEIETMATGAFTMTAELAVRFLDDYITGDKYFKTLYAEHNLVRAKNQIKLAYDMLDKLERMNDIIYKIAE